MAQSAREWEKTDSVEVDERSQWQNPFRCREDLSDSQKAGVFFDWIDRQPWYREAMRRELAAVPITASDPGHEWDAGMLREIVELGTRPIVAQRQPFLYPVLVFGSNRSGRHGRGAARTASRLYGAEDGIGEGQAGQSYALPTKDVDLESLSVDAIQAHVDRFIEYAESHPETEFMLTRVGCRLAAHRDETIGPLFAKAPKNVFLPGPWERYVQSRENSVRILVAGSDEMNDAFKIYSELDAIVERFSTEPTLIVGSNGGSDHHVIDYAQSRNLHFERFPAWWRTESNAASYTRDQRMLWRSTHMVAFADKRSRSTQLMIEKAKGEGVKLRVIDCT